jgi:hypothetical protein
MDSVNENAAVNAVKTVTVAEPTFKKLRELKALGFDAADMGAFNSAYVTCLQDQLKLKKVADVLFVEKLTEDDLDNLSPAVIWDGITGFFGKSNVRML